MVSSKRLSTRSETERQGECASDGVDDEWTMTPGATGYLLHSWKIRFPHPAKPEDVEVICPPPAALAPRR